MAEMLEGTIKTPLGVFEKKTVAIVGGIVVGLAVVVWYRNKNAKPDPSLAGTSEINPATGYPYGSAEDAAALTAQNQYQFPSGSGGGGGGGGGGTQFTDNAQWTQYVITYMNDNDLVDDVSPLAAALGKYIAGQPVDAVQTSLIQQAIAIAGKPPLAGPSGYPPSINTEAVVQPPPPTNGGGNTAPVIWLVKKGWHVEQWLADVRAHKDGNPGLYWEQLLALNPGVDISANINWTKDLGSRTFKNQANYRIK